MQSDHFYCHSGAFDLEVRGGAGYRNFGMFVFWNPVEWCENFVYSFSLV